MATLTYLSTDYVCTTAIKGDDYIHLLDADGVMIAAFDAITDFSLFTLTDGEYVAPTADDDCFIAVVRDDGSIGKGSHRCSDIGGTSNDGSVDTTLLIFEDPALVFSNMTSYYSASIADVPFALIVGDTYHVEWDGEWYTCVNRSGWVGNRSIYAGADDTGEPFVMFIDTAGVLHVRTNETIESHSIKLYHKEAVAATRVPKVTSDDEGKFLQVVGGVWTVVSLSIAEEGSF